MMMTILQKVFMGVKVSLQYNRRNQVSYRVNRIAVYIKAPIIGMYKAVFQLFRIQCTKPVIFIGDIGKQQNKVVMIDVVGLPILIASFEELIPGNGKSLFGYH